MCPRELGSRYPRHAHQHERAVFSIVHITQRLSHSLVTISIASTLDRQRVVLVSVSQSIARCAEQAQHIYWATSERCVTSMQQDARRLAVTCRAWLMRLNVVSVRYVRRQPTGEYVWSALQPTRAQMLPTYEIGRSYILADHAPLRHFTPNTAEVVARPFVEWTAERTDGGSGPRR